MSAVPWTVAPPDIGALERRLNGELAEGRLLRAYARYYLQAGLAAPGVSGEGAANERVLRFLEWAERFVGAAPLRSVVVGTVSRSEWRIPAGSPGDGGAVRAVVRRWSGERVACESVWDLCQPGVSGDD